MQEMNSESIFGQAMFAILRKSERDATPHAIHHKVASHLLLPQPSKTAFIYIYKLKNILHLIKYFQTNAMKNTTLFLLSVMTSAFVSCCGQNTNKGTLIVEAYSSYNNSDLPSTLSLTNQNSNYDSTIKYALDLIGLPNTDIEVETTPIFGAFSVINRQSQRRFFLYSPTFFDSVYKVTQTNYAILGICFHELAHHFYRHPLKPSNASHFYEKQADRYSGFELAIIGATLEQSLAAMNNIEVLGGKVTASHSHPDKASRLAEIEKGYIDARIKIFKDSSFIKLDSIFKMQELMYALYENKSFSEIQEMSYSNDSLVAYSDKAIKKSKSIQVYSFYGELIYLTTDKKVKLLDSEQTIGDVLQPNLKLQEKILNLDGVKFYLEQDKIYSVNPDGFKLEVGNKITN